MATPKKNPKKAAAKPPPKPAASPPKKAKSEKKPLVEEKAPAKAPVKGAAKKAAPKEVAAKKAAPKEVAKKAAPKEVAAKKAAPKEVAAKKPGAAIKHKLVRATSDLKKHFAEAQTSLRKLRGEGTKSFDALYELIGHILTSDPPLYIGGGYRSKEDFIASELPGETLRSVTRNILVARCFSPKEEAEHGIAFLEEVALYAKEITGASEPPPAIDLDKLTLTLPGKGGSTLRKKARSATIDDVREARRLLRKGAANPRSASPLETALRVALGTNKALSAVTVRTQKQTATFSNVPVADLAAFAQALSKTKLRPPESEDN